MQLHALLGAAGVCAVVGSFALAPADTPATPPALPKCGHLVLQLEGNVKGLKVTWITPKQSGFNRTKSKSDFAVDLLDAAGRKLGTYAVDLSHFDTNPANIGKAIRVQGCEVLDSKIATIVNVPWFATLTSLQIRHRKKVIGTVGAAELVKRVQQGDVR